MGYFSNLAIAPVFYDPSVTPPELPWLWRLEELENRLRELDGRENGTHFSTNDLRYVLAKDFHSTSNVQKAIDLAISDLAERYGIFVRKESQEKPSAEEDQNIQISFLDILSMQVQHSYSHIHYIPTP